MSVIQHKIFILGLSYETQSSGDKIWGERSGCYPIVSPPFK